MKWITVSVNIFLQCLLAVLLFLYIIINSYITFVFTLDEQLSHTAAWLVALCTGLLIFHFFWFLTLLIRPLIQRRQINATIEMAIGYIVVWLIVGIFLRFIVNYIVHNDDSGSRVEPLNQDSQELPIINQYVIEPIRSIYSQSFEWLHFLINPLTLSYVLIGCSLSLISIIYVRWNFEASRPYWVRWYFLHCKVWNNKFIVWSGQNPDFLFHCVTWFILVAFIWDKDHFTKTLFEKVFYFTLSIILFYVVMILRLNRAFIYKLRRKQLDVSRKWIKWIENQENQEKENEFFFLILVTVVSSITYLENLVGPRLNNQFSEAILNKNLIPMNIGLALCGFLAATAERSNQLNREKLQEMIRKEQLNTRMHELSKSQLQLLTSQINSHFFFASLKFLQAESRSVSEKFSESILLLSNILHYTLDAARPNKADGSSRVVHLKAELEHIENYIQFGKQTSDAPIYVSFVRRGDYDCIMIIPLLLVTFVENAFKYGEIHDPANPVEICIAIESYEVVFIVRNKKIPSHNVQKSSTGLGLENVRSRLNIEYPDAYELTIFDGPTHFDVKLALKL